MVFISLAVKFVAGSAIQSLLLTGFKCGNPVLNCWNNYPTSWPFWEGLMHTWIGRIQFWGSSYVWKLIYISVKIKAITLLCGTFLRGTQAKEKRLWCHWQDSVLLNCASVIDIQSIQVVELLLLASDYFILQQLVLNSCFVSDSLDSKLLNHTRRSEAQYY